MENFPGLFWLIVMSECCYRPWRIFGSYAFDPHFGSIVLVQASKIFTWWVSIISIVHMCIYLCVKYKAETTRFKSLENRKWASLKKEVSLKFLGRLPPGGVVLKCPEMSVKPMRCVLNFRRSSPCGLHVWSCRSQCCECHRSLRRTDPESRCCMIPPQTRNISP